MAGRLRTGTLGGLGYLIVVSSAACTKSPVEPAPSKPALSKPASADPRAASGAGALPVPAAATEKRCVREMTPAPAASAASAAACPKDPSPQTFAAAKVEFLEPSGGPRTITVELARTSEETARGLMYRRSMPEDHGMLFDLRVRKPQAFWMRNTCIPLDMMFVEDDGLIVGILENVPVLNEEERSVGCPSRYVLEVNAGFSRKHGIKPGQKLKLPSIAP